MSLSFSMDIPNGFICPITNEIMRDPVMDPEGNSFEKIAIDYKSGWLIEENLQSQGSRFFFMI
jgi:hypothetical protein